MTSNINYTGIDATFPVAGRDNDSQGFRDNFAAIVAGFASAKTEITTLQTNGIDVTATSNDLQGTVLKNGTLSRMTGAYYNAGSVATATNINLDNGPAQKVTLSSNTTLTFTNWPASGLYSKVRVIVASDQTGVYAPTFTSTNSGVMHFANNYPAVFSVGGEGIDPATLSVIAGSGFLSATNVVFANGSPLAGFTLPTGVATYKVVSVAVSATQGGSTVTGSGGTGYAQGDIIVCNANSGITCQVTSVNGGGTITGVSVVSGGVLTLPILGARTFSTVSGTGSGARLVLNTGIDGITITNPGDGYTTTPPDISFNGGGGVGASATVSLTSGTTRHVKVIEAWTVDGGDNIYVEYIGEF